MSLNRVCPPGALKTLARDLRHFLRASCTLDAGLHFRPGHEVESHLYRIAQEALNLAIIHGRLGRIATRLTRIESHRERAKDKRGLESSAELARSVTPTVERSRGS